MEIKTDKKKPRRPRSKKIARYILSIVPYLLFLHVRFMLNLQQKTEKRLYKVMLKHNLLDNYLK